jgi:hypothetical protein
MNYLQSCCVILEVAQRLGIASPALSMAQRTLQGTEPDLILSVSLEKESVRVHNLIAVQQKVDEANRLVPAVMQDYQLTMST